MWFACAGSLVCHLVQQLLTAGSIKEEATSQNSRGVFQHGSRNGLQTVIMAATHALEEAVHKLGEGKMTKMQFRQQMTSLAEILQVQ